MQGAKTWVEINAQALRSNIAALRSLLSEGVTYAGVVKSNAYGHGLSQIVPIMRDDGVAVFCVDSIDEAILVRALAPSATIIILGYTLHDRLADVVEIEAQQTVYDPETIQMLNDVAAKAGRTAKLHLKIETGTMRQGIWPEQVAAIAQMIAPLRNVELVGVSTHYANVDEAESQAFAEYQTERFWLACNILRDEGFHPPWIHLACSAAVILYPQTHGTLVRPGVSTYGFWPSRQARHAARLLNRRIELEPVMSWKTRVAQIKDAPMGTPIGFGCSEVLRRHSKVAIIPVGYYDGYDRRLSSVGEVIIRGQLCRVLGRVCMNMIIVDVTEIPKIMIEDEVVLIGRSSKNRMRAEDIADRTGTIAYEVTTRIHPLIPRIVT